MQRCVTVCNGVLSNLQRNWRYVWCKRSDGSFDLNPGMLYNTHWGYQYLSSVYWSLTMLMKTAYIGPDTFIEKLFACIMVVVGSLVFIVVLGARATAVSRL